MKLSLKQFEQFVLPHLSRGRRGPAPTLALHTIFNYTLPLLYTSCQWKALQIKMNAKGRPEIHYTLSGSRRALLRSGPLRTVHAPFNAHGSSLSKPPFGSRFHHC
jgi:hypothetical protein